jgi:hypothetical protein
MTMANLLESMLSGGKVKRQDNRHLNIATRPLPLRPRQLFELFGALGLNATFPGLLRSVELKHADPQHIVFIALGRWPSLAEIAAFPEPYNPGLHLVALIRSPEFRAHFVRNACDAFAERKRLLYVRIPRSGGGSVLTMLDGRHPLLPLDLIAQRFNDPVLLIQTMGTVLSRMATSKHLAIAHTRMAPFLSRSKRPGAPESAKAGLGGPGSAQTGPVADDPFAWRGPLPPCRVEDTLFTVLREPHARALGQINALLRAWQSGDQAVPVSVQARMDRPAKRARPQDWRQLGRDILAETVLRDPVCHALGDGTAEGMQVACSRSPLQLVQLEQLNQWSRTALENMASDSVAASEAILRRQDLGAGELAVLEEATQQDRIVHERFIRKLKETGLPVTRARDI